MTEHISSGKLVKAYFLAGLFLSFLAINIYNTGIPDLRNESKSATLSKLTEEPIVLRDAAAEGFSYSATAKAITFRYHTQFLELPVEEPILQPSLLVTQSFRNVFYVYVSSLAP